MLNGILFRLRGEERTHTLKNREKMSRNENLVELLAESEECSHLNWWGECGDLLVECVIFASK